MRKEKEEKKQMKKFFRKLDCSYSGMVEEIFFKFGMWLLRVEGTSTINLVPFRLGIT